MRRIACDAGIIPGRARQGRARSSTSADGSGTSPPPKPRALWLRDGSCTFPDCSVPGVLVRRTPAVALGRRRPHQPSTTQPCSAGGTTPFVHQHGLPRGSSSTDTSEWDRTLGAYDHWLTQRHRAAADAAAAAPDPPAAAPGPPYIAPDPPATRTYDGRVQLGDDRAGLDNRPATATMTPPHSPLT